MPANLKSSLVAKPKKSSKADEANQAALEIATKMLAQTAEFNARLVERLDALPEAIRDAAPVVQAPAVSVAPTQVTVPPREPRSYYATIERDSEGVMTGARIDPV